jgi:dTDP-4-dehydrorhamnose 3,5-epimerase
MIFKETTLKGAFIIELEPHVDERGYFARSYCQREFEEHGLKFMPVQSNFSYSKKKGTLRGMHFQIAPYEEIKLISCIQGAVHDAIIDLRPDSPTCGKWFAVELTAENHKMLYVPEGFAHGFQTLVDDTAVFYQMSEFYHPECEKGVRWDDLMFGIEWPLPVAIISERDSHYPDYSSRDYSHFCTHTSKEIRPIHDSLTNFNITKLAGTLTQAERKEQQLREIILKALCQAQSQADNADTFRNEVRLPILRALLHDGQVHRVVLENGLIFEVGLDSRIEEALLLSSSVHPDHVWEPQTTKLLVKLATDALHMIVGGAYIGDQVLLIARAMMERNRGGMVHAFDPMEYVFNRLLHHLKINGITNVLAYQIALWEKSNLALRLEGEVALAGCHVAEEGEGDPMTIIKSITIDDYVALRSLPSVGLIMLDIEGGEEKALAGASKTLSLPFPEAPHLIFEVHRTYVDWSSGLENTSIVNFVRSKGYTIFAIRDFHDNYPMAGKVIEIIPVDRVYLEGPPHGFNLLATKDSNLVRRLGLRVVENVSPKLLVHKNPALHHPLDGLP